MIDNDPLWYKDAVFYQIHVRAYQDGVTDGVGDFRGLRQRLDYIQDLGVTAVWLQPFYPSPLKDDGYDIADYTDIHPQYGTLEDFKRFPRDAAHRRGIRVITELVVNHTSDQHPWFQRARRAPKGSPEREMYVWSDTPDKYTDARIIFKDFERSNWTWDPVAEQYFWHRFYSHQPDLNFDNPAVWDALTPVLDFWMEIGRGRNAPRRHSVPVRARGDELREPAGDARLSEALPRSHGLEVPRKHVPGRSEPVARRRHRLLRRRRTSATWRSTSR